MTYSTSAVPVRGGALRVGRWEPEGEPAATVLAVHGVTANHRCWGPLAARASDLDLHAPDLRGRGRSGGLPGPAGLRRHADDLAAVLDAADLDSVVVVGHSMGGLVSVVFADRYPERVDRLVLVDGGLPLHPLPGMSAEETMTATLGPAIERLSQVFADREEYQAFWARHPAFAAGISPAMADYFDYDLEEADGGFKSSVSPGLVREDVVSQLDPGTLTPALERLRVPTAFVWAGHGLMGGPDPLYPLAEARDWASRLPLLDLVELPGPNHYTVVFDDEPIDRIVGLLRGAPAPQAASLSPHLEDA